MLCVHEAGRGRNSPYKENGVCGGCKGERVKSIYNNRRKKDGNT